MRIVGLILMALALAFSSAHAQGTAFTYQGRLNSDMNPATGIFDLRFVVYDAASEGSVAGSALTNAATPVTNGLFTVMLDFGNQFPGAARWLEIAVRTNGNGAFTALVPRQPILPTPYSVMANSASNLLGSLPAAQLTGTLPSSVLAGYSGTVALTNGGNSFNGSFSGSFGGNGAGLTNVPGSVAWQNVTGTSQQAQPNTGYLANNPGLVIITLPASTALGDVFRVTGKGAGGWKIAQNSGQSIITKNIGGIGVLWTPRGYDAGWIAVASSADASTLVALPGGGPLYTSTNSGVDWVARQSSGSWGAAAVSADGVKMVAVGANVFYTGPIYTSTNSGVTWTSHETNRNWTAVASSADGTALVAVAYDDYVYTSTDSGITWTPRFTDQKRHWYGVASSTNGSKLVAIPNNGPAYLSTDYGITWTNRGSARQWMSVASSADGNKLVGVVSPGQIYTSADSGLNWNAHENDRQWSAVASSADGTRLIAAANGSYLYVSTDSGATWNARLTDQTRFWDSVASSADGSRFVAVGSGTYVYTSWPATTPGTAGSLTGDADAAIELQSLGNSQFLPLSHEGAISAY